MSRTIVHCLQHSERVRPLTVVDWAVERGLDLRVVRVDLEPLPPVEEVERLVVLGGGMNTDEHDEHPWLLDERAFLREVIARDVARVLGICLGSQLIVEAIGGSVQRSPTPEIGWQHVRLTDAGRRSHVFSALPDSFHVMQWHGDEWLLPRDGAALAATSDGCANQAFTAGPRVSGVQFHPEFTLERTSQLAATTTDDLAPRGWIQSPDTFLAPVERFVQLRELCLQLLDRALLHEQRSD